MLWKQVGFGFGYHLHYNRASVFLFFLKLIMQKKQLVNLPQGKYSGNPRVFSMLENLATDVSDTKNITKRCAHRDLKTIQVKCL